MSDKLSQVLQRQKEQISQPFGEGPSEDEVVQLVGFVVSDEEYAVPILNIQEIIKPIDFTRVPSVPDYVLGVFNMRGRVTPLIDLARLFNLGTTKFNPQTRYIVLKNENKDIDSCVGFVIDRLTEAIKINKGMIDPPPETIVRDKGMIYGIGKRDNNILTILKAEALLKRDF